MKKQYVIIGASAAGIAVANRLKILTPGSTIICISAESENPYNKCHIADYLAGNKHLDQLSISNPGQEGITFMLGKRVISIDRVAKEIRCDDNVVIAYDYLFLGMGSSPRIPSIKGIKGKDMYTFHTLKDAQMLDGIARDYLYKKVAIIGAGLSGIECADALAIRGMKVTLIEQGDQLLSRHVDKPGSHIIERAAMNAGVSVLLSAQVDQIIRDHAGTVLGVQLTDGTPIAADLIVCTTGLYPNNTLAQEIGLAFHGPYIAVDDAMRTSDPHIFAGGDLVMVKDQITKALVPSCLWPDAMLQGMIGAFNMAGIPKSYPGAVMITSSAFFGLKFASCGPMEPVSEPDYSNGSHYKRLIHINGILKGFILVGDTSELGALRKAILTGQAE